MIDASLSLAIADESHLRRPLLLHLPFSNDTNTGEVSEIVTVSDGNHFVVAAAGVGLFLIESDATTGAPVAEMVFPLAGPLRPPPRSALSMHSCIG